MKAFLILISLYSVFAQASDFETRALMEKTYAHDNSYCRVGQNVVEFEIRSFEKYTQPDDADYGEHIFALHNKKRMLLPLNSDNLSRFKLLKGENPNCSKVLSLKLDQDVLAVFFLKDNRPLGNLFTVLFYDLKNKSSKVLTTDFVTSRGFLHEGKLKFPSLQKNPEAHMGKIVLNGTTYIYRDSELVNWISFDGKTFQTDGDLTFEKFEWKNIFSKEEFERAAGLDSKTGEYQQKRYIMAVNHLLKRRCLVFSNLPASQIAATEWKCR